MWNNTNLATRRVHFPMLRMTPKNDTNVTPIPKVSF